MSNLARLNELRRTAKALGIDGASRMKTADLEAAIAAAESEMSLPVDVTDVQIEEIVEAHAAYPDEREAAIREVAQETGESPAIVAEMYDALVSMEEERALVEKYEGPEAREDCTDPECSTAAKVAKLSETSDPFTYADITADPFAGNMLPERGDVEYPVVRRDPDATRYEDIEKWTDERLFSKEDELARRLSRRTLLGSDRRMSENRLARVKKEIEARGI